MGIRSSGCAAVDAMDRIRISGNIIPQSWYEEILRDNGKPYLLAITLLADIVYWYRPTEERDESSGCVIGLKKKFKGDLLQKTYDWYADLYGESKRTIKAALDRLEELGLIRKVFRDLKFKNGTKLFNVMFIEIFPDRIEEISHYDIDEPSPDPSSQEYEFIESAQSDAQVSEAYKPSQTAQLAGSAGGGTKFCRTPYEKKYDPLQNNVSPSPQECTQVIQNCAGRLTADGMTYTENTSETTEEITTEITTEREQSPVKSCPAPDVDNYDDDVWLDQIDYSKPLKLTTQDRRTDRDIYIEFLRDQVQYDRIVQEDTYGDKINIVDGIINIIADIATTNPPDGYERVNGRQYPHEVVKSRLLKMDYETIIHVLERFKENKTEIRNMRSYLLTALYNARDEKDIQFQNFFNHSYYGTDWTGQRKED